MSKWIEFQLRERPSGMKTDIYDIFTKDGTSYLGAIRWYAAWRKYTFQPANDTIFENQCLRDIIAFIDKLMEDRKK